MGKVTAIRRQQGRSSESARYYVLSQPCSPERCNDIVRGHWGIANWLHWILDVTCNEDRARNRQGNSTANLALLRKLALNLARLEPGKGSVRGKLKRAGWDNAVRLIEPRYYGNSEVAMLTALAQMWASGCRFAVAGRIDERGAFRTLADVNLPGGFHPLFMDLPETAFCADLSSTAIRERG